jgi:hypothetical protein
MSLQGPIEAECPACGDAFEAPVWSFVHGGTDAELRDRARAGEVNLLLCPSCGEAFLPNASWVYFEPEAELLAFVFPASYRAEEGKWREKMKDDFSRMRGALAGRLAEDVEPAVYFGPEGLAQALEIEEWRREEREVMEYYARELKLSLYRVRPSWARANQIPSLLPFSGPGKATRRGVVSGIKALLSANDRLTAWGDALSVFEKDLDAPLPPEARA